MRLVAVIAAAALAGCTVAPTVPYVPEPIRGGDASTTGQQRISLGNDSRGPAFTPSVTAPSTAAANAFAVAFLSDLNVQSFRERREFCGYFLVDEAGNISATPPNRGEFASCGSPFPGPNAFATYHTHGAYDEGYDNEVPSDADLLSDFSLGFDGYVATPGGRVWHVEYDDRTARQVCGLGCIAVDPGFVPVDEAGIRQSYTLPQIRQRYQ